MTASDSATAAIKAFDVPEILFIVSTLQLIVRLYGFEGTVRVVHQGGVRGV
jgi:hypothetical protein